MLTGNRNTNKIVINFSINICFKIHKRTFGTLKGIAFISEHISEICLHTVGSCDSDNVFTGGCDERGGVVVVVVEGGGLVTKQKSALFSSSRITCGISTLVGKLK